MITAGQHVALYRSRCRRVLPVRLYTALAWMVAIFPQVVPDAVRR